MSTAYIFLEPDVVEDVPVVFLADADYRSSAVIQKTQEELIEYIDSTKPKQLIINFRNVKAISSEFLTSMIRAHEYVTFHEGTLKLSNMSDRVRAAFKVTNLDGTMFHIYPTMPNAIDAF